MTFKKVMNFSKKDVNAGTFVGTETKHLKWMIENIQQVVDKIKKITLFM